MTVRVANPTGISARVNKEYLHFDDPRVGGIYGTVADQGATIQAWWDLAAASTGSEGVGFLAGDVRWSAAARQLQWPTAGGTKFFRLLGAGAGDYLGNGGAALVSSTDPGVGKWAVNIPLNAPVARMEKVLVLGLSDSADWGERPWEGGGIYIPTAVKFFDVRVRGFGDNVGLVNDHQEFFSCDFRGGGINVNFLDNPLGGLGDLRFERCYLIDAGQASIAVASTNCIANALFTQGHSGGAPFGIYRYQALVPATGNNGNATLTGVNVPYTPVAGMSVQGPQSIDGSGFHSDSTSPIAAGTVIAPGGVSGSAGNWTITMSAAANGTVTQVELGRRSGQFVEGATFSRWSWEYPGNNFVYDEVGGGSFNCIIDGNGEAGVGGAGKWPGKPAPLANIHCNSVNIRYRGNAPGPQVDGPNQPYLNVVNARITMDECEAFFDAAANNSSIPAGHKSFVKRAGSGDSYNGCVLGIRQPGSGSLAGCLRVAAEAIAKGDLLEDYQTDKVRKWRGGDTSRAVGLSAMAYATDDVVLSATQGKRTGIVCRNKLTVAIAQNKLVVGDPANPGCVKLWTGPSDGPHVGRIHDTAIPAAGGTFTGNTSTSVNPTIVTNVSSLATIKPGAEISGAGIPAGAVVLSTTQSPNTMTLSAPVTATATGITITLVTAVGPVDVWIS